MKRRKFLKLLSIAPFAPSVLKAKGIVSEPFAGDVLVENVAPLEFTEAGWSFVTANPTGTDYFYELWQYWSINNENQSKPRKSYQGQNPEEKTQAETRAQGRDKT